MKCVFCKTGDLNEGHTTVTLRRDETVVVIVGVRARICDNCEHYYLDSETAKRVQKTLFDAVERGTKFELLTFQEAPAKGVDAEILHLQAA